MAILNSLELEAAGGDPTARSGRVSTNWFRNKSPKKIAIVGDSVTDGNATAGPLYNQLTLHQRVGGALENVTVLDFGSNGLTLSSWLTGGGRVGAKLADLPTDCDIVIGQFLINDVRTGNTSLVVATNLLIQQIDAVKQRCPNAQFILSVPNTLTTDDFNGNGYVTLTGQFSGMTMTQAGQTASSIMRRAYYDAWKARPACGFVDLQLELTGTIAIPKLSVSGSNPNVRPGMVDQLHPGEDFQKQRADIYASALDVRTDGSHISTYSNKTFNQRASTFAHTENFGQPFQRMPRALLDDRYWIVSRLGTVGTVGGNYIDLTPDEPDFIPTGSYIASLTAPGDVFLIGDQATIAVTSLPNGAGRIIPQGANWGSVNMTTPLLGDVVYHARSKSARSVKARQLQTNPNYPFQRIGYITARASDGSYIDVAAFPSQTPASSWGITNNDTVFVSAEAQDFTLTSATLSTSPANSEWLRITQAGFFAISGLQIAFFGASR